MAHQVEWTKRAQTTFNKTVDYLQKEFGDKSAEKFIQKIDRYVDLIAGNPQFGKVEEVEKYIRGILVSNYSYIFYRIEKEKVIVLKFFDGRQDPKKRLK